MNNEEHERHFDEALDLRERSSLWSAKITGQVFKSVRPSKGERAVRIFSYAFSLASAAALVLAIMLGAGNEKASQNDVYAYFLTGNQGLIDASSPAFYEGVDLYIDYAASLKR